MSSYATKDQWAIDQEYASWNAYATANPNTPPETTIDADLEECTFKINEFIGCTSNVTNTDYTTELKYLNIKMVNRKHQVRNGENLKQSIPFFSPNSYLIEEEKARLRYIGLVLGHRAVGGLS